VAGAAEEDGEQDGGAIAAGEQRFRCRLASIVVDGDEDIIVCREPGVFAKEVGEERSTDVWVEQQVELGDWRAGFVIHHYDWICEKWRVVIVECDGHDFHERTKEQAARDRSRDRRASLSGFVVLRFTGSEIWKDPLGCAEQVMRWFMAESVREKPLEILRATSR